MRNTSENGGLFPIQNLFRLPKDAIQVLYIRGEVKEIQSAMQQEGLLPTDPHVARYIDLQIESDSLLLRRAGEKVINPIAHLLPNSWLRILAVFSH